MSWETRRRDRAEAYEGNVSSWSLNVAPECGHMLPSGQACGSWGMRLDVVVRARVIIEPSGWQRPREMNMMLHVG